MRAIRWSFDYSYVRAPTQQVLNVAERLAAYKAADMDKVAATDDCEEQFRKWKSYYHSIRKYHACIYNTSSSKDNSSS